MTTELKKPPWLKVRFPGGETYKLVSNTVAGQRLHTVCQEARCPNVAECWGSGTATFLILGDVCTRGCGFCAVTRGAPQGDVDWAEPKRVSEAAREMGLNYVVVTSVTRDDLADGGASVFRATVEELRLLESPPLVELLIPDLVGAPLDAVLMSGPDVLAHNIEVVERLTGGLRHRRFDYRRSLGVLRQARESTPSLITKSSILLGLGETASEVEEAMGDLLDVEVNILVLGQYLQPTPNHAPVKEYVPPERFEALARRGRELGFDYVAAGPLVRTSYRAAESFVHSRLASTRRRETV